MLSIMRLSEINEDALRLIGEYYEAFDIVQRDTASALQETLSASHSGIWLAYQNEQAVGCVVPRRLASKPFAAECKRLFVQPEARGGGIAGKLLDVQEEFARERGVQSIYLDSNDGFQAAIALYKKRGYIPCPRYNDNPQATIFLRKQLAP